MGKRYYCDYCERSFADGAENRKKHLVSVIHQKLRKEHYDLFKDASTILEENKHKKPCRKFHSAGFCEFGTGCKYSHLSSLDIHRLEEQARSEKSLGISKKRKVVPDIDKWLEDKVLKMEKTTDNKVTGIQLPILPSILANISDIPPSLIPCKPSDLRNQKETSLWG